MVVNWCGNGNTEVLVPVFVVAVLFVVLAAIAHRKRVNMSALGIGVDFLQIMSIFTNFGFQWPVSLKALFQYSSLSTFNDQMMAPECTVTSWNFENKWYIMQAVPAMFILSFALLYGYALASEAWKKRVVAKFSVVSVEGSHAAGTNDKAHK